MSTHHVDKAISLRIGSTATYLTMRWTEREEAGKRTQYFNVVTTIADDGICSFHSLRDGRTMVRCIAPYGAISGLAALTK